MPDAEEFLLEEYRRSEPAVPSATSSTMETTEQLTEQLKKTIKEYGTGKPRRETTRARIIE